MENWKIEETLFDILMYDGYYKRSEVRKVIKEILVVNHIQDNLSDLKTIGKVHEFCENELYLYKFIPEEDVMSIREDCFRIIIRNFNRNYWR